MSGPAPSARSVASHGEIRDWAAAAQALIDAVQPSDPVPDSAADPDTIRRLIAARDAAGRPALAHAAAARITGGGGGAIPALVAAAWPVLAPMLGAPGEDGAETEAGDRSGALALLLVLRAFLDGRMAEAEIRARHLAAFPTLPAGALALPYSVMFDADAFGANRDDLLARYPDAASARGLPPRQALILEWLSGGPRWDGDDATGSEGAAGLLALRRGAVPPGAADPDLAGLRDRIAAARATLPGAPPDTAPDTAPGTAPSTDPGTVLADRLDARPRQAARAALNLLGARLGLPHLHLGRRAPRVALCVSGQLRGHVAAWETWRRHLLPGAEVAPFVHAWRKVGRADAQPFRQVLPFAGPRFAEAYRARALSEGYDAMRAALPALFAALEAGGTTDVAAVAGLYGTDHVVLEDDGDARFAAMSNQAKMHYKIHAADALARGAGAADADLIVRLRPDLPLRLRGFAWPDLAAAARAAPILWAEKPHGLHYDLLMMGDQCAVGAPATMAVLAGTWERFPEIGALAARGRLAPCPADFAGHASLALTCWLHGIAARRLPAGFGPLRDAAPMSAADTLAALESDGADPTLLAAARADTKEMP